MPSPVVPRLLLPWSGRDLLRQRLIAVASVLAIALGVAVFVAIRQANRSATASFESALSQVAGRSDLELSAAASPLPDRLWGEIDEIPGIAAATPLLDGLATVPELGQAGLRIHGIDPFTVGPFRGAALDRAARGPAVNWLGWPAQTALDRRFAERHGIAVGRKLVLQAGDHATEVTIAALIEPDDAAAPENRLWADIGWSQEILDRVGELDSIQVQAADPDHLDDLSRTLATLPSLPADASVGKPGRRGSQLEALLAGYQLNLTCLALVSLLVGAYLIYSAMAASVARRGREIAALRALGARRSTVAGLVLAEALILGVAGIALGLPLGVWAGRALLESIREGLLVRLVADAGAIYQVRPGELVLAAVVGLLATVLGAAVPAWETLQQQPALALRPPRARGVRPPRSLPLLAGGAAALLGCLGCALLALHTGPRWLSFASCLLLVLAATLWLLPACAGLLRALSPLFAASPLASLAQRNFLRSLPRARLTMAGLVTALAMVGGVEVMIHSFRSSVDGWIVGSLGADFFVSPVERGPGREKPLAGPLLEELRRIRGVDAVETLAQTEVELDNGRRYLLNAIDSPGQRHRFELAGGDPAEAGAAFYRGEGLLVSEALASAEGLRRGDSVTLKTPQGPQALPLLGVLVDYSDDVGRIYLDRGRYTRHWPEPATASAALYLNPAATPGPVRHALEAASSKHGAEVWDRRGLRERALAIFDATFRITYALRAISLGVAVLGAFALVTILLRERAAELAAMRAQGISTRQLFRLLLWEGGLLGATAGLLGTLCGLGLALLLTWVVLKCYFGWSVRFAVPWDLVALLPVGMLLAVMVAVVLPAWRASRQGLIHALREE